MVEVRISRILTPARGYQSHHRHFKEHRSYLYGLPILLLLLLFLLRFPVVPASQRSPPSAAAGAFAVAASMPNYSVVRKGPTCSFQRHQRLQL